MREKKINKQEKSRISPPMQIGNQRAAMIDQPIMPRVMRDHYGRGDRRRCARAPIHGRYYPGRFHKIDEPGQRGRALDRVHCSGRSHHMGISRRSAGGRTQALDEEKRRLMHRLRHLRRRLHRINEQLHGRFENQRQPQYRPRSF